MLARVLSSRHLLESDETRTRDSNCHRHFSFIDSLILIADKFVLYRLCVDVVSTLSRVHAIISLILLNTRFLKSLTFHDETCLCLHMCRRRSTQSMLSRVCKTYNASNRRRFIVEKSSLSIQHEQNFVICCSEIDRTTTKKRLQVEFVCLQHDY